VDYSGAHSQALFSIIGIEKLTLHNEELFSARPMASK